MGQRQMARGHPRGRWPKNLHAGIKLVNHKVYKEIKFNSIPVYTEVIKDLSESKVLVCLHIGIGAQLALNLLIMTNDDNLFIYSDFSLYIYYTTCQQKAIIYIWKSGCSKVHAYCRFLIECEKLISM